MTNFNAQKTRNEAGDSTTSIPRKKRQYRLFHCKLCPEHVYSRGARCKAKSQKTVEGHVGEVHPGRKYEDLVVVWGHMVQYDDGTCARVPLSAAKILGNNRRRADRGIPASEGLSTDLSTSSGLSKASEAIDGQNLRLRVSASAPASVRVPTRRRRPSHKTVGKGSKVTNTSQAQSLVSQRQGQASRPFQTRVPQSVASHVFSESSLSPKPTRNPTPPSLVSAESPLNPFSYQPSHAPTTPTSYTAGSVPSLHVSSRQMHPLDAAAILGSHGELIATLASRAFSVPDVNDANEAQPREHQLVTMLNYMRVQRDYFTNNTLAILPYHMTGPDVFQNIPLSTMHPLDIAAILGNHGIEVAALAGMAFFGPGANDEIQARSREQQMMAMIDYLRVQRDWLTNNGAAALDE